MQLTEASRSYAARKGVVSFGELHRLQLMYEDTPVECGIYEKKQQEQQSLVPERD